MGDRWLATRPSAADADAPQGAWIREHRVWWETVPGDRLWSREPAIGGLELRLYARCPGARQVDPSRPEYREVHERLEALVATCAPAGLRWRARPYAATLYLRPEAQLAPEVELEVEILRDGSAMPADILRERRLLSELARALRRSGARLRGGVMAA